MAAVPQPVVGEPTSEKSSERFNLRATPSDAALVRQAAFARHQSVTEFMLQAALETAQRVLEEDHTITVPGELYQRLQEELKKPGVRVEGLAKLLKQPRRLKNANE